MRCVCTIADRKYAPYLQRFIHSVRAAGWREEIVVLTNDEELYCNNTVIYVPEHFTSSAFPDPRWLKLELDRFFDKGDEVIFLDSDIVLFDGFPFEEILGHKFGMTTVPMHHDVTNEMPEVNKLLNKVTEAKYLASPISFRKNRSTTEFFDLWRSQRALSVERNHGTMFALNMACHMRDMSDCWLLPEDRCAYTLSVRFNEPVKDPVLMHYGGMQGKEIWMGEYRDGKDYGYILKD